MSGSVNELACVYSALILYDDGIEVTADKIQTLCKAADVQVDAIWPKLFAKALEGKDIGALLSNVGSATAAAPVGGGVTTTTESTEQGDKKEEKKEEKKPESEEESDDDMGFGLFD